MRHSRNKPVCGFPIWDDRISVLTQARRDIKNGEDAGDRQEHESQTEVPSRADPIIFHVSSPDESCSMSLVRGEIPSAPPEYQLLGVLHIAIDLPVFEEPVGFEGVCVRIQGFVMKNRPFRSSIKYQKRVS